jgi:hypothetical protein
VGTYFSGIAFDFNAVDVIEDMCARYGWIISDSGEKINAFEDLFTDHNFSKDRIYAYFTEKGTILFGNLDNFLRVQWRFKYSEFCLFDYCDTPNMYLLQNNSKENSPRLIITYEDKITKQSGEPIQEELDNDREI